MLGPGGEERLLERGFCDLTGPKGSGDDNGQQHGDEADQEDDATTSRVDHQLTWPPKQGSFEDRPKQTPHFRGHPLSQLAKVILYMANNPAKLAGSFGRE